MISLHACLYTLDIICFIAISSQTYTYTTTDAPEPKQSSRRGKDGPASRRRFTDSYKFNIAKKARLLYQEPDYQGLTEEGKAEKAGSEIKSASGKSQGLINMGGNILKWTRPVMFAELEERCREKDPSVLNEAGKHKGGRGKKKAGGNLTSRTDYPPWFDGLETTLDAKIKEYRRQRIKVDAYVGCDGAKEAGGFRNTATPPVHLYMQPGVDEALFQAKGLGS